MMCGRSSAVDGEQGQGRPAAQPPRQGAHQPEQRRQRHRATEHHQTGRKQVPRAILYIGMQPLNSLSLPTDRGGNPQQFLFV